MINSNSGGGEHMLHDGASSVQGKEQALLAASEFFRIAWVIGANRFTRLKWFTVGLDSGVQVRLLEPNSGRFLLHHDDGHLFMSGIVLLVRNNRLSLRLTRAVLVHQSLGDHLPPGTGGLVLCQFLALYWHASHTVVADIVLLVFH